VASALKLASWCGLLGAVSALVGSVWAARQATTATYRHRYGLAPLAISTDEIEFPETRHTLEPGEFGLQLAAGGEPAIIGPIISTQDGRVTRKLLHRPDGLTLESRGRWSGIVSVNPSTAAADAVETFVATPLGPAPAWMIGRSTTRWVIHVHGQGSDRRQTLRGVDTSTTLGLSSLVISYRNDGEGPGSHDGRSHLGEDEWLDLEAALRFVAERGGRDCLVFGWSMGATMALNAMQRSSMGTMIKGIVMVAPVLAWEDAFRANARHQGWPQSLGSVVSGLLSSKGFSRKVGLDAPLPIRSSDRARFEGALNVPILILHNKNDWSVPIDSSFRFARAHRDMVEIVPFDCSGHTQEWNADRVGWDLAVRRWYGKLFQPGQTEDQVGADGG
jgi:uncharacterized protein